MKKNVHFSENDELKKLGFSTRAYNYCLTLGLRTVKQLLDYYAANNNYIQKGKNAGICTANELNTFCYRAKMQLRKQERPQKQKPSPISANNEPDTTSINISVGSDSITDWVISVRAYNVLQANRLATKDALLKFYYDNGQSIPNTLRNCGKKTIGEIEQLCIKLIEADGSGPSQPDSSDETTPDLLTAFFKSKCFKSFPARFVRDFSLLINSLTEADNQHLITYYEAFGHYPLLWILAKYIESDKDLSSFALVYGINFSMGAKSISEIATEMNITQTGVSQRAARGYDKLLGDGACINDLLRCLGYTYLIEIFNQKDCISSSDSNPTIKQLNRQEKTSFTNTFILRYLSSLFGGYVVLSDVEKNKPFSETIVISKETSDSFNFEAFFSYLDSVIENASDERDINIREEIEDSPYWRRFSLTKVESVLAVVKSYLLLKHGLYEENLSDTIHIRSRKIDVAAIVYSIVSSSSAPLTLQEIIDIASKRYPSFPFLENAVRIALRDDMRIQFKRAGNKPTRYLLASNDVPTSIRDAIVRVLSENDEPVPLDDIVGYVLTHFPSSSKNSIRTSILNDGQSRFVQFEGSLYGLASKTYSDKYVIAPDNSRMSFAERLIYLKKFLNEENRFPSHNSEDTQEVDFAKWVERNHDKPEVKALIDTYASDIWTASCKRCELFIVTHNGRIPSPDKEPELFKWLLNATIDMNEDRLNQDQRRQFLHLKMQIRK